MADPFTRLRKFIDFVLAFLSLPWTRIRVFCANAFRRPPKPSTRPAAGPDLQRTHPSSVVEGAATDTGQEFPLVKTSEHDHAGRYSGSSAQHAGDSTGRPDVVIAHDQVYVLTTTKTDEESYNPPVPTVQDFYRTGVSNRHDEPAYGPHDLNVTTPLTVGELIDSPGQDTLSVGGARTTHDRVAHTQDDSACELGTRHVVDAVHPLLEHSLTSTHDHHTAATAGDDPVTLTDMPVAGGTIVHAGESRTHELNSQPAVSPVRPELEGTIIHDRDYGGATATTNDKPNDPVIFPDQAIPPAEEATVHAESSRGSGEYTHEGELVATYPQTTQGDIPSDVPSLCESNISQVEPIVSHPRVSSPEPRPTLVCQPSPASSSRSRTPSLSFPLGPCAPGDTTHPSLSSQKEGTSATLTTSPDTPAVPHTEMEPPPDSTHRPPKKAALLIGIMYKKAARLAAEALAAAAILDLATASVDTDEQTASADPMTQQETANRPEKVVELQGPYSDCLEWEKLLIEVAGYKKENIVVLLDDGIHPEPTRLRIIAEMKKLVSDAQAGDTFCFLFSGHGHQVPCLPDDPKPEPDQKDEVIVAADDPGDFSIFVRDNEIKVYLCDSLPVGATLVAVCDCCHSGSMFDLDHCQCNQIWIPWNARRRPNDKRPRRRDAVSARPLPTRTDPTPIMDRTLPGHLRVYASTPLPSGELSSKSQRVTREIAISIAAGSPKSPGKIERVGRRTQTSFDDVEVKEPGKTKRRASTLVADDKFPINDLVSEPDSVLTEEPEDSWSQFVCDGSCRQRMKALKGGNPSGPTVIQIGAAADGQMAWQWGEQSMTRALIQVLRENPQIPMWQILQDVSREVYKVTQAVRSYFKQSSPEKYKEVNAQDLQIASETPLDMDKPLPL